MSVQDIMKRKAEDVKEPENLPPADWEFRCIAAKMGENEDFDEEEPVDRFRNPTHKGHFTFVPVKPVGNLAKEDEAAVQGGAWRGKTLFHRFGIAGDADLWELNKVFTGLGISLEGRGYEDLIPLAKNRTTIATVGLRSFKRRDGTPAIDNTLSDFRQPA